MASPALVATSLAAGLQILLFAGFSLTIALTRAFTGIHYGSGGGGKKDLFPLSRAQANVAEYGPYIIASFFLTEYQELLSVSTLKTLAAVVFLLRLAHGLRLAAPDVFPLALRLVGFFGTIGVLIWLAILNVTFALSSD